MKFNTGWIQRFLACVLALLLALGEIPVAVAATSIGTGWDDDCRGNAVTPTSYGKHKWVLQFEDQGNSCTSPGVGVYNCAYCGATTTHPTSAPGHKWGSWRVTSSATCVSTGTRERTCSVCGRTETESIARTDHSWGEWIVTKEATCAEQGSRTRTCSICGTSQTQSTSKSDHAWGAWTVTKEATCQHTGTRVRTCRVCGKKDKGTLKKTDHHYGAWEVTLASTWNVELAEEMGVCVGEFANTQNVSGWYAPAMNGHRSPFAGRNFEYYSEDPYLAGAIGSWCWNPPTSAPERRRAPVPSAE